MSKMKRKVLIICQREYWETGKVQAIQDWHKIEVFPYSEKHYAQCTVKALNSDIFKKPVHLREGWLIIGKKVK